MEHEEALKRAVKFFLFWVTMAVMLIAFGLLTGCATVPPVQHEGACGDVGRFSSEKCKKALPAVDHGICRQASEVGYQACEDGVLDRFVPIMLEDHCVGKAVVAGAVVYVTCKVMYPYRDCELEARATLAKAAEDCDSSPEESIGI